MFSQEAQVLLFKTHFLVVNLLVVNVSHYLRQVGSAYSESSVTFLPCEAFSMVIHPSRRVSLEQAHRIPQELAGRQVKQHVYVIVQTSNRHRYKVNVVADSSEVLPQSFLNILCDEFGSLFRAEHDVQMILRKCVRHILSPLPGLYCNPKLSHR